MSRDRTGKLAFSAPDLAVTGAGSGPARSRGPVDSRPSVDPIAAVSFSAIHSLRQTQENLNRMGISSLVVNPIRASAEHPDLAYLRHQTTRGNATYSDVAVDSGFSVGHVSAPATAKDPDMQMNPTAHPHSTLRTETTYRPTSMHGEHDLPAASSRRVTSSQDTSPESDLNEPIGLGAAGIFASTHSTAAGLQIRTRGGPTQATGTHRYPAAGTASHQVFTTSSTKPDQQQQSTPEVFAQIIGTRVPIQPSVSSGAGLSASALPHYSRDRAVAWVQREVAPPTETTLRHKLSPSASTSLLVGPYSRGIAPEFADVIRSSTIDAVVHDTTGVKFVPHSSSSSSLLKDHGNDSPARKRLAINSIEFSHGYTGPRPTSHNTSGTRSTASTGPVSSLNLYAKRHVVEASHPANVYPNMLPETTVQRNSSQPDAVPAPVESSVSTSFTNEPKLHPEAFLATKSLGQLRKDEPKQSALRAGAPPAQPAGQAPPQMSFVEYVRQARAAAAVALQPLNQLQSMQTKRDTESTLTRPPVNYLSVATTRVQGRAHHYTSSPMPGSIGVLTQSKPQAPPSVQLSSASATNSASPALPASSSVSNATRKIQSLPAELLRTEPQALAALPIPSPDEMIAAVSAQAADQGFAARSQTRKLEEQHREMPLQPSNEAMRDVGQGDEGAGEDHAEAADSDKAVEFSQLDQFGVEEEDADATEQNMAVHAVSDDVAKRVEEDPAVQAARDYLLRSREQEAQRVTVESDNDYPNNVPMTPPSTAGPKSMDISLQLDPQVIDSIIANRRQMHTGALSGTVSDRAPATELTSSEECKQLMSRPTTFGMDPASECAVEPGPPGPSEAHRGEPAHNAFCADRAIATEEEAMASDATASLTESNSVEHALSTQHPSDDVEAKLSSEQAIETTPVNGSENVPGHDDNEAAKGLPTSDVLPSPTVGPDVTVTVQNGDALNQGAETLSMNDSQTQPSSATTSDDPSPESVSGQTNPEKGGQSSEEMQHLEAQVIGPSGGSPTHANPTKEASYLQPSSLSMEDSNTLDDPLDEMQPAQVRQRIEQLRKASVLLGMLTSPQSIEAAPEDNEDDDVSAEFERDSFVTELPAEDGVDADALISRKSDHPRIDLDANPSQMILQDDAHDPSSGAPPSAVESHPETSVTSKRTSILRRASMQMNRMPSAPPSITITPAENGPSGLHGDKPEAHHSTGVREHHTASQQSTHSDASLTNLPQNIVHDVQKLKASSFESLLTAMEEISTSKGYGKLPWLRKLDLGNSSSATASQNRAENLYIPPVLKPAQGEEPHLALNYTEVPVTVLPQSLFLGNDDADDLEATSAAIAAAEQNMDRALYRSAYVAALRVKQIWARDEHDAQSESQVPNQSRSKTGLKLRQADKPILAEGDESGTHPDEKTNIKERHRSKRQQQPQALRALRGKAARDAMNEAVDHIMLQGVEGVPSLVVADVQMRRTIHAINSVRNKLQVIFQAYDQRRRAKLEQESANQNPTSNAAQTGTKGVGRGAAGLGGKPGAGTGQKRQAGLGSLAKPRPPIAPTSLPPVVEGTLPPLPVQSTQATETPKPLSISAILGPTAPSAGEMENKPMCADSVTIRMPSLILTPAGATALAAVLFSKVPLRANASSLLAAAALDAISGLVTKLEPGSIPSLTKMDNQPPPLTNLIAEVSVSLGPAPSIPSGSQVASGLRKRTTGGSALPAPGSKQFLAAILDEASEPVNTLDPPPALQLVAIASLVAAASAAAAAEMNPNCASAMAASYAAAAMTNLTNFVATSSASGSNVSSKLPASTTSVPSHITSIFNSASSLLGSSCAASMHHSPTETHASNQILGTFLQSHLPIFTSERLGYTQRLNAPSLIPTSAEGPGYFLTGLGYPWLAQGKYHLFTSRPPVSRALGATSPGSQSAQSAAMLVSPPQYVAPSLPPHALTHHSNQTQSGHSSSSQSASTSNAASIGISSTAQATAQAIQSSGPGSVPTGAGGLPLYGVAYFNDPAVTLDDASAAAQKRVDTSEVTSSQGCKTPATVPLQQWHLMYGHIAQGMDGVEGGIQPHDPIVGAARYASIGQASGAVGVRLEGGEITLTEKHLLLLQALASSNTTSASAIPAAAARRRSVTSGIMTLFEQTSSTKGNGVGGIQLNNPKMPLISGSESLMINVILAASLALGGPTLAAPTASAQVSAGTSSGPPGMSTKLGRQSSQESVKSLTLVVSNRSCTSSPLASTGGISGTTLVSLAVAYSEFLANPRLIIGSTGVGAVVMNAQDVMFSQQWQSSIPASTLSTWLRGLLRLHDVPVPPIRSPTPTFPGTHPPSEHSTTSTSTLAGLDLGLAFERALLMPEGERRDMALSALFEALSVGAISASKAITRELYITGTSKHVKRPHAPLFGHSLKLFAHDGMYIRRAYDPLIEREPLTFLFGGSQSDDEAAHKAMGRDLHAISRVFHFLVSHGAPVYTPPAVLVDYAGHRFLAQPRVHQFHNANRVSTSGSVSSVGDLSLVYGSLTPGHVVNVDPAFDAVMTAMGHALHVASHSVHGTINPAPCSLHLPWDSVGYRRDADPTHGAQTPSKPIPTTTLVAQPLAGNRTTRDYVGQRRMSHDAHVVSDQESQYGESALEEDDADSASLKLDRAIPTASNITSTGGSTRLGHSSAFHSVTRAPTKFDYVLMGMHRLLPAESSNLTKHLASIPQSVFSRRLRPEFLLHLKNQAKTPPLSSDALLAHATVDPSPGQNKAAHQATKYLCDTRVSALAAYLDQLFFASVPRMSRIAAHLSQLCPDLPARRVALWLLESQLLGLPTSLHAAYRACFSVVFRSALKRERKRNQRVGDSTSAPNDDPGLSQGSILKASAVDWSLADGAETMEKPLDASASTNSELDEADRAKSTVANATAATAAVIAAASALSSGTSFAQSTETSEGSGVAESHDGLPSKGSRLMNVAANAVAGLLSSGASSLNQNALLSASPSSATLLQAITNSDGTVQGPLPQQEGNQPHIQLTEAQSRIAAASAAVVGLRVGNHGVRGISLYVGMNDAQRQACVELQLAFWAARFRELGLNLPSWCLEWRVDWIRHVNISRIFHAWGVPMRHIQLVIGCSKSVDVRQRLLFEVVLRTFKNIWRARLRNALKKAHADLREQTKDIVQQARLMGAPTPKQLTPQQEQERADIILREQAAIVSSQLLNQMLLVFMSRPGPVASTSTSASATIPTGPNVAPPAGQPFGAKSSIPPNHSFTSVTTVSSTLAAAANNVAANATSSTPIPGPLNLASSSTPPQSGTPSPVLAAAPSPQLTAVGSPTPGPPIFSLPTSLISTCNSLLSAAASCSNALGPISLAAAQGILGLAATGSLPTTIPPATLIGLPTFTQANLAAMESAAHIQQLVSDTDASSTGQKLGPPPPLNPSLAFLRTLPPKLLSEAAAAGLLTPGQPLHDATFASGGVSSQSTSVAGSVPSLQGTTPSGPYANSAGSSASLPGLPTGGGISQSAVQSLNHAIATLGNSIGVSTSPLGAMLSIAPNGERRQSPIPDYIDLRHAWKDSLNFWREHLLPEIQARYGPSVFNADTLVQLMTPYTHRLLYGLLQVTGIVLSPLKWQRMARGLSTMRRIHQRQQVHSLRRALARHLRHLQVLSSLRMRARRASAAFLTALQSQGGSGGDAARGRRTNAMRINGKRVQAGAGSSQAQEYGNAHVDDEDDDGDLDSDDDDLDYEDLDFATAEADLDDDDLDLEELGEEDDRELKDDVTDRDYVAYEEYKQRKALNAARATAHAAMVASIKERNERLRRERAEAQKLERRARVEQQERDDAAATLAGFLCYTHPFDIETVRARVKPVLDAELVKAQTHFHLAARANDPIVEQNLAMAIAAGAGIVQAVSSALQYSAAIDVIGGDAPGHLPLEQGDQGPLTTSATLAYATSQYSVGVLSDAVASLSAVPLITAALGYIPYSPFSIVSRAINAAKVLPISLKSASILIALNQQLTALGFAPAGTITPPPRTTSPLQVHLRNAMQRRIASASWLQSVLDARNTGNQLLAADPYDASFRALYSLMSLALDVADEAMVTYPASAYIPPSSLPADYDESGDPAAGASALDISAPPPASSASVSSGPSLASTRRSSQTLSGRNGPSIPSDPVLPYALPDVTSAPFPFTTAFPELEKVFNSARELLTSAQNLSAIGGNLNASRNAGSAASSQGTLRTGSQTQFSFLDHVPGVHVRPLGSPSFEIKVALNSSSASITSQAGSSSRASTFTWAPPACPPFVQLRQALAQLATFLGATKSACAAALEAQLQSALSAQQNAQHLIVPSRASVSLTDLLSPRAVRRTPYDSLTGKCLRPKLTMANVPSVSALQNASLNNPSLFAKMLGVTNFVGTGNSRATGRDGASRIRDAKVPNDNQDPLVPQPIKSSPSLGFRSPIRPSGKAGVADERRSSDASPGAMPSPSSPTADCKSGDSTPDPVANEIRAAQIKALFYLQRLPISQTDLPPVLRLLLGFPPLVDRLLVLTLYPDHSPDVLKLDGSHADERKGHDDSHSISAESMSATSSHLTSVHDTIQQSLEPTLYMVRFLVDVAGANVNFRDSTLGGMTPLFAAARRGYVTICRFLIARGAWVDLPSFTGQTPLFAAAMGGHTEVAALLLRAGANPDWADKAGRTPLHTAVRAEARAARMSLAIAAAAAQTVRLIRSVRNPVNWSSRMINQSMEIERVLEGAADRCSKLLRVEAKSNLHEMDLTIHDPIAAVTARRRQAALRRRNKLLLKLQQREERAKARARERRRNSAQHNDNGSRPQSGVQQTGSKTVSNEMQIQDNEADWSSLSPAETPHAWLLATDQLAYLDQRNYLDLRLERDLAELAREDEFDATADVNGADRKSDLENDALPPLKTLSNTAIATLLSGEVTLVSPTRPGAYSNKLLSFAPQATAGDANTDGVQFKGTKYIDNPEEQALFGVRKVIFDERGRLVLASDKKGANAMDEDAKEEEEDDDYESSDSETESDVDVPGSPENLPQTKDFMSDTGESEDGDEFMKAISSSASAAMRAEAAEQAAAAAQRLQGVKMIDRFEALARNCVSMVKLLIRAGADANAVDNEGQSAFFIACRHGRWRLASLLATVPGTGGDVFRCCDAYKATPLMAALAYPPDLLDTALPLPRAEPVLFPASVTRRGLRQLALASRQGQSAGTSSRQATSFRGDEGNNAYSLAAVGSNLILDPNGGLRQLIPPPLPVPYVGAHPNSVMISLLLSLNSNPYQVDGKGRSVQDYAELIDEVSGFSHLPADPENANESASPSPSHRASLDRVPSTPSGSERGTTGWYLNLKLAPNGSPLAITQTGRSVQAMGALASIQRGIRWRHQRIVYVDSVLAVVFVASKPPPPRPMLINNSSREEAEKAIANSVDKVLGALSALHRTDLSKAKPAAEVKMVADDESEQELVGDDKSSKGETNAGDEHQQQAPERKVGVLRRALVRGKLTAIRRAVLEFLYDEGDIRDAFHVINTKASQKAEKKQPPAHPDGKRELQSPSKERFKQRELTENGALKRTTGGKLTNQ